MSVTLPKHGSPADRGSADAYYGRPFNPHYWPEGTGKGLPVMAGDMTAEQIAEYRDGFDNEDDRKDWGEMQKIAPKTYNGQSDAEHILENIMQRQRWSVRVRDEIAGALVKIARGESITTKSRGKKS